MIIRLKENYLPALYCVVGFDDNSIQSYNGGNATLVTFNSLGDAEDFVDLLRQHNKDASWDDEIDPEEFDVTGGYLDDFDYLTDLGCEGCYTASISDILNADEHDVNIIPGYEVVILNKQDLYDKDVMYLYNIPDKYYK